MVRRIQLMEPESGLRPRLARATARLRDGLLRDNKVIPPVLGALALIVFAWIVAGALIDDPREGGGGQQVANQANQPSQQVAQNPDEGQDSPETPAPSVENRDTESYAAFEQKDPFRELFQPPDTGDDGGTDDGGTGDDQYGDGGTDDGGTGDDGTADDPGGGDGNGGGGDDFIDQTFPGDPGFDDDGGGSSGSGGGGTGAGGDDDLFDSGGNLAP